jgi:hypothetical protein
LVPATRSDVQRHDALVEQHTAHFTLDDAQCQAFRDGALAHTGFPDENGIVLLTAAKDLADPFDLLFSSDDGIQLAVLGHLGQIASEVVQHRGLALAIALFALTTTAAARETTALFVIVIGALRALGLGLRSEGVVPEATIGQDGIHLVFHVLIVHLELVQRARGEVVLVLQHAQEQVLGIDLGALEELGFQEGDLEHLLGLLDQGDLVLVGWPHRACGFHGAFHHFTQFVQVHFQAMQDLHCVALAFADQAQQDMLNADVVVSQAQRFFTAEGDDVAHTG